MNDTYKCKCDCGYIFSSDELIEKHYQEYAGASYQSYWVSPCCQADYEEIED